LFEFLSELYTDKSKVVGFNSNYYVIRNIQPYQPTSLTIQFERFIRQSGCKPITLHGLRHSHASLLIDAGLEDVLIAERLGHSVQMLHQVYAHVYKRKETAFNERLNEIF
jgi:integrase